MERISPFAPLTDARHAAVALPWPLLPSRCLRRYDDLWEVAMPEIIIRDMLPEDEYFVGTCSHVNESAETDAAGMRRIAAGRGGLSRSDDRRDRRSATGLRLAGGTAGGRSNRSYTQHVFRQ